MTTSLLDTGSFSYETRACVGVQPPTGTLTVSWADIYKYAIMVGYGPSLIRAIDSAEIRIAAVRTALRLEGGRWLRNPSFTRIDESDKVGVSYNLGMMIAALTARRLLGLPYLVHLSVYQKEQGLPFRRGKRSDFIATDGRSSSALALVEAKGRGSAADVESAIASGRQQLSSTPIAAPLKIVSAAYFTDSGDLSVVLDDPPDENLPTRFPASRLMYSYFAPLVRAMTEVEHRLNASGSWVAADLKSTGLRVALPADIFEAVSKSMTSGAHRISPLLVRFQDGLASDPIDGFDVSNSDGRGRTDLDFVRIASST